MVGLSEGEKHFIRGGIAQDLRTDGRRRLQFRSLSVQTGVIPQVGFTTRFWADTHTPLSFPFFSEMRLRVYAALDW
jgi:hypothetical protein